ncbi:MAG: 3'(2'),5'-bisphosphate nucleotidase CysQ [Acidimicrobiia bacterium]|nr:3'(2'),5'-bisphosphate nucleotidase CysQ [Acidimicrobiia bacterium]
MERVTEPEDLDRIHHALDLAAKALEAFTPGEVEAQMKLGDDPLTAADVAVDEALRNALPRDGEGWLSEETADDPLRLECSRVWIVDPIDGTREFVMGIPEWCVSIALVVDGRPVAGGILSVANDQRIVGSVDDGITLNGESVACTARDDIRGALVLGSRSEVKRGEWAPFFSTPIAVRNMGSVAYKLGLVAAGLADATWTLVPKNEWDVAGGAALVAAAGGAVMGLDYEPVMFNQPKTLMKGFIATAPGIEVQIQDLIRDVVGLQN